MSLAGNEGDSGKDFRKNTHHATQSSFRGQKKDISQTLSNELGAVNTLRDGRTAINRQPLQLL